MYFEGKGLFKRNKKIKLMFEIYSVFLFCYNRLHMYYPWLKFDFIYFKLIIINYHTQRQKKIKLTPKIKKTHKKNLNIIHMSRVES